MGQVDIFPDTDLGGYPLLSTPVGFGTRHQTLSDASDATYTKQEGASSIDGIDIYGFQDPAIPAGAVVTGGQVWMRVAHDVAQVAYSFSLQAPPKDQYKSPAAPEPNAACSNVLGADRGNWYYHSPADSLVHEIEALYAYTWAYNNGYYAWDYLSWDKIDLTNLRMFVGWYTPPGTGTINRMYRLWLRIFYDEVPEVANVQPADLSAGDTFTTTPTIEWDYSDTENGVQTQYQVRVIRSGSYDAYGRITGSANFDPGTAVADYDSGIIPGAALSHTVGPRGLENLADYYAYVRVWHAPVNGNEMRSLWEGSALFTVNGVAPETPTITALANDAAGRIEIDVVQGNWDATPYTEMLYVQRSKDTADDWEDMRGGINASTMSGLHTGADVGNHIATPHHASLAITGDMEVRACIALEGPPTTSNYLVSKSHLVNGASWYLRINTAGKLQFEFNNGVGLSTAISANAIPFPANKVPFWIRAKHFTASNWHTEFYYSLDPIDTPANQVEWTSLGPHNGTGAGTITSTNSELVMNGIALAFASNFRIYYMELRDTAGQIQANPDFRGLPLATTSFVDGAGKTWTIYRFDVDQTLPFITLYDYEVNQGEVVNYRAQAITLDAGSPVGTEWDLALGESLAVDPNHLWWFKVIHSPGLNHMFDMVPGSWDGHRPVDAAAFSPLSRPFKVVVSGGAKANEQSLVVECLSLEDYEALLAIYNAQLTTLVQTYEQDRYFAFIDWKDDRGTLANGYAQVTLTAVEVERPIVR